MIFYLISLMTAAMIAKKIFYEGKVQGVGFRYSVKQIAAGFDVSGTVENLPDGRVEVTVQGDLDEVDGLIEDISVSHLKGFIKQTEMHAQEPDLNIKGFSIKR
ncbi:MAG: acylphosphatase [Verrucomicrobiota bacterium]